jgi:glycerol-3-phosphate dehydrogenase (NAD(P)+)
VKVADGVRARVAVVGAGAWGTVFAQICADAGTPVRLLTRDAALAEAITANHVNDRNYPGVRLPDAVTAGTDPAWAFEGADVIAVAVGAQTLGDTVRGLAGDIGPEAVVASLVKGIERGSGRRMSQVIADAAGLPPGRVAAVSGPNLAGELVQRQPGATVVACPDEAVARRVGQVFATEYMRPYSNPDVTGVEVCGAVKNIIALAIGAACGMGLGLNTQATMLTRGLAEMTRLGLALGAELETFQGMAGVGDLAATCLSPLSRNHQVGVHLGQGRTVAEAVAATKGTAEAVETAPAVRDLARGLGVEMPITEGVVAVIHEGMDAARMGHLLLTRPYRSEGSRYEAWQ